MHKEQKNIKKLAKLVESVQLNENASNIEKILIDISKRLSKLENIIYDDGK